MSETKTITITVADGLIHGSRLPPGEEFTTDEWPNVVKAFARFHIEPPSRKIAECCNDLMRLMLAREPITASPA